MEALRASYGADSEGSDADDSPAAESMSSRNGAKINSREVRQQLHPLPVSLPPPPLDLLQTPDLPDFSSTTQGSRIRSFPHVEGNYALHVYIPVLIPTPIRTQLSIFIKQIASLVPGLCAVDCDFPIAELCKDNAKLEQILLGREFHISLGRTVPIQAHQIESIVAMLRQRFQSQRRYFIDFNKWDVFVNDEQTRSFLALEVMGAGLSEISKQIRLVDVIYRLHGLPEFYKNPRPHISLLWGLGDTSGMLNQAVENIERSYKNSSLPCRHIFTCKINGIECRIGKRTYSICKFSE
ncbi:U6 snRNA phosphodiesterase-like isoform X2 [Zingiber officinale]|uniref:U6 snRNA phosphodiesterase-like isoform X2 n=1 Tax=Zingiber officinale TaxID=94328 RepID=UPI001C4CCEC9|nr:U6 snRNA phosphodiesterase-like isoform X2 [Zingiber officinale]